MLCLQSRRGASQSGGSKLSEETLHRKLEEEYFGPIKKALLEVVPAKQYYKEMALKRDREITDVQGKSTEELVEHKIADVQARALKSWSKQTSKMTQGVETHLMPK